MKFTHNIIILRLSRLVILNIVVTQAIRGITMNIKNIFYNCIRTISIVSILSILSIGFILPISLIQALLINPIILVSLMIIFAIANEKLQPVTQPTSIVRLPDNSKSNQLTLSKVA